MPVLGVCLGHQALGAGVRRHGRARRAGARQDGRGRARRQDDLRRPRIPLVVGPLPLAGRRPGRCRTSSRCRRRSGDVIMGLRHRELPAEGVQFHPESVLTAARQGSCCANFLADAAERPVLTDGDRPAGAAAQDLDRRRGRRGAARDHGRATRRRRRPPRFLIALRTKGETVDEIAGLAAHDARAARCRWTRGDDLVDTAGTGGGRPTFNVSTTAAFVAAGAGCRVAKHGNRSATSQCGSADVLEALGARIDLEPGRRGRAASSEVGFGFMFAPLHHPAMQARRAGAQGARRAHDLQLPRPADQSGRRHAPGDRRLRPGASWRRWRRRWRSSATESALVVSSADGLDEFSVSGADAGGRAEGRRARRPTT